jgi:hypothetical protein
MASFLDMETSGRRLYVVRMFGLSTNHPESWPVDLINSVIEDAERKADEVVRDAAMRYLGLSS